MVKEKVYLNRIKAVLVEHRIKQEDLADHLGVTRETVSRWSSNTNQPPLEILFKIAKFVGCNVCDLLSKDIS